ncbi:glucosamine-6-phosphate deaminase [Mumia zhuanghuii]|uniref:Glucosamine-6-phosphate deaminase n=2 Tax=Mumia TaxID=1546255 RepID=A0ABW1QRB4_9ACTN|nr:MULTISPECIES: glucosamine-6-phosphate deaminase [Mumia]KAA1420445.1 glucosamine-6-phosphate deaminase [Mumia zhuanghuii]
MEVVICESAEEIGRHVADVFAAVLRGPAPVIGLATGSSPLVAYQELIRRHREDGLSFAGTTAFLLDEYVGLPAGHPESYAAVIRRELTEHVDIDPADVHSPDGGAADLPAECARYDAAIGAAGGVHVQLLGIGTDGHIGFNEPMSSLSSRTRPKTLTQQTRDDNARFFGSVDEVPRHVLTQGLGTIGTARHLVMVATGTAKAEAVAAAVEGPLSARCPASILQWHQHATVFVDEAAASELEFADYYRHALAHKPEWQGF